MYRPPATKKIIQESEHGTGIPTRDPTVFITGYCIGFAVRCIGVVYITGLSNQKKYTVFGTGYSTVLFTGYCTGLAIGDIAV